MLSSLVKSIAGRMMIKIRKHVEIMVDNKLAIDLAKNLVSHGRRKHRETRFSFLKDQVNKGKLDLVY